MAYLSTGNMKIGGCFRVRLTKLYEHRFSAGDVVYRTDKAKKGKLEKIAVKIVHFVGPIPMYIDTYNAIYAENDLSTLSEANALVAAWIAKRDADRNSFWPCGPKWPNQ